MQRTGHAYNDKIHNAVHIIHRRQRNFYILVDTYRIETSMSTPRTVQMYKLNFQTNCRQKDEKQMLRMGWQRGVRPKKITRQNQEQKKNKLKRFPANKKKNAGKTFTRFFLLQKCYQITETKITNIFSIKEFSMAWQSSHSS